jgi:hypothetical protein
MICLNCKKQIPDDSDRCPNCGTEVFHKNQLAKEIGFRRYQRWIFYVLFILAFVGMVGIVVKIYSINNKLISDLSSVQGGLSARETELAQAKTDLAALQKIKTDLESQDKKASDDLTTQIAEAQKAVDAIQSQFNQSKTELDAFRSTLAGAAKIAAGIAKDDLDKIPFADFAYFGPDQDADGLPDNLEAALGTSATSTDTDGDNYSDRAELIAGFNPLGAGNLPIDKNFSDKQKGKLFLQSGDYLWYVGSDAKRYFLGQAE